MYRRRPFAQSLASAMLSSCLLAPSTWAAGYAYKVTMTIVAPKGSGGEKLATNQPSSTKTTPCSDTLQDQVTITVTYDAGKTALEKRDLFIILHSPTGTLYPVKKYVFGSSPTLQGPYTPSTLVGSDINNIYTTATDNLGRGAQTETLFGGYISLRSIPTGTWQIVAILANSGAVDFGDPVTWAAWDTTTLIVGKPWTGDTKASCGPGFFP